MAEGTWDTKHLPWEEYRFFRGCKCGDQSLKDPLCDPFKQWYRTGLPLYWRDDQGHWTFTGDLFCKQQDDPAVWPQQNGWCRRYVYTVRLGIPTGRWTSGYRIQPQLFCFFCLCRCCHLSQGSVWDHRLFWRDAFCLSGRYWCGLQGEDLWL